MTSQPQNSQDSASNKRRVIAIGDIHGCAEELEVLLRKLNVQKDDLVVFLGDYIDRGADSRRVIDIILDLKKSCEVVALRGNHEAMFLDFLNHPESPGAGLFVLNGGTSTLARYTTPDGGIEIPDTHLEFFQNLRLSYETDDYFFVHAGIPNQPLSTLNEEEHELHMLWARYPFLSSDYQWEKLVIHGHTPAPEVEVRPNRINLDTGCVYDGKLTALELPKGVLHQVAKGIKNEPPLYPKEIESSRISKRYSGRIPVEARLKPEEGSIGGPFRKYETLNYNRFGILMREVEFPLPLVPVFEVGQWLEGRIGAVGPMREGLDFVGVVTRCEARASSVVYGVLIDRIADGTINARGVREWVSRPDESATAAPAGDAAATPAAGKPKTST